jgi:hypothetical protein
VLSMSSEEERENNMNPLDSSTISRSITSELERPSLQRRSVKRESSLEEIISDEELNPQDDTINNGCMPELNRILVEQPRFKKISTAKLSVENTNRMSMKIKMIEDYQCESPAKTPPMNKYNRNGFASRNKELKAQSPKLLIKTK